MCPVYSTSTSNKLPIEIPTYTAVAHVHAPLHTTRHSIKRRPTTAAEALTFVEFFFSPSVCGNSSAESLFLVVIVVVVTAASHSTAAKCRPSAGEDDDATSTRSMYSPSKVRIRKISLMMIPFACRLRCRRHHPSPVRWWWLRDIFFYFLQWTLNFVSAFLHGFPWEMYVDAVCEAGAYDDMAI